MQQVKEQKIEESFFRFVEPVKNPSIFKNNLGIQSFSFFLKSKRYSETFLPLEDFFLPSTLKRAHVKRKSEFISSRIALLLLAKRHFIKFYPLFNEIFSLKDRFQRSGKIFPFPEGLLGSVTHSNSFVSVALCECGETVNFGMDAQKIKEDLINDEKKLHRLECKISSPNEISKNLKNERLSRGLLLFLIFSAKESLYKCMNTLGFLFRFQDVELDFKVNGSGDKTLNSFEKKIDGTFKIKSLNTASHRKKEVQKMRSQKEEKEENRKESQKEIQKKGNWKKKIQTLDKRDSGIEGAKDFSLMRDGFQKDFIKKFLKEPWRFGRGEFEIEKGMIHTSFMLK